MNLPRRTSLDCRSVVELLTAWLDGALDARTARSVGAHLAGCVGCTEFLAQLVATVSLVRLALRRR